MAGAWKRRGAEEKLGKKPKEVGKRGETDNNRKKKQTEIEESKEEDDTQMSGVTEKKEAGEQMEMAHEEEKTSKKRGEVVADGDRVMGFGSYRRNTYGEVLGNNPRYAMYLIEEGKRGNRKARFTHWVVAFVVGTFFEDDMEGMGNSTEGEVRSERQERCSSWKG